MPALLEDFLKKHPVSFTAREEKVLRCLIDGATDRQIAERTGISIGSVRQRTLQNLYRKLGVHNRTQAALWGWLWGYDLKQK